MLENNDLKTRESFDNSIIKNKTTLDRQSTGVYNVKSFGAVGDGITDDWEAINDVLNIVKVTGGTVFFPTGIYAVSKPIEVNTDENSTLLHNIVLKGVESNIPYFNSYRENSLKLAMNSNIIPTNNFTGDALLKIGRVSNSLITKLALIGTKDNQSDRTIKGIEYCYKGVVSNNAIRYCTLFRFSTGIDGYYSPILKIEYTNVQYCKNIGIVIRGDSRIVECEVSCTGVTFSGAVNEMKQKSIFTPSGYYGGTGIQVIDSAGNTNIMGGLIDWNCKGIVCDAASGLIINGVRFHHNAEQHIWIRSRGSGLGNCGFNITGCRFLGGGFITGSLDGKSHITVTNDSSTQDLICGNISSNVFRFGDWDATESSESKLANPTETSGALNTAIIIKTNCNVDLTITGNDMVNCGMNGAIGVTQTDNSKVTKIKFLANNYNKLGWTSGIVRLYRMNSEQCNFNGLPTWTGIQNEITINENTNPYEWNNYIYSTVDNMWIGFNQRNIKYSSTINRPVRNGFHDRGYRYYDTSINKIIMWDGFNWRDMSGTEV